MAYTEYAVYRSQMATHSALNRYRTVPPINSESPNGKEDNEENETGDENNENDEQLRSSDEDEQLDIVEEDDEQFDSLDAYRDRYSRLHRDGTKPEDIFPELKKVARRLHAMMSENDFSNTVR